jgi:hypothetical protein
VPATITVNGQTYTRASNVQAASASSLLVNGQTYLTPAPLASYPRSSIVVISPNNRVYIWTRRSLVLPAPPCASAPWHAGCLLAPTWH